MEVSRIDEDGVAYALDEAFTAAEGAARREIVAAERFRRQGFAAFDGADVLLDTFPDVPGAACAFVRLARGEARDVRLVVRGINRLEACPAGGWLLGSDKSAGDSYWIPQPPSARTVDPNGRILSQQPVPLAGFGTTADGLAVDVCVPQDTHLDVAIWRLPTGTPELRDTLERPLAIEQQPAFLRSSHATYRGPADLYLCLVHGQVYDNRFVWRRMWGGFRWRICSENEAYSLYHIANGLELATGRRLHTLLKRQILFSVVARQSPDGGWHHGEWTDLMESHFRLHNAGVQLLEAALDEEPDAVIRGALERAAAFTASKTDQTDVGEWFLHDALEEGVDKATANEAPPWDPVRILRGSPANKWILNTHLDAVVALTRYARLTGDTRHDAKVASARAAAHAVLAMRPAEWLYRPIFKAVWLTLLPSAKAKQLSFATRVVRRLARERLIPRVYQLRRRFPRFVMPGGLIDRHLAPRHFDMNYHAVNLMDVARFWRCFPEEDLTSVVDGAVDAVTRTGLLETWIETKQKQSLGYWVEALYHLATQRDEPAYRRHLAEAVLAAEDADLGLPPSLFGADTEAIRIDQQVPCPSPTDPRLRVANLSRSGARELLVVNPSNLPIELAWQTGVGADLARQATAPANLASPAPATATADLVWQNADGGVLPQISEPPTIPPRSWLLGRD